jgi:hypothetical protein
MAYALVSKTNGRRTLWVQVPPPAENLQTSLKGAPAPIAFDRRFYSVKSKASVSLLPLGGFL